MAVIKILIAYLFAAFLFMYFVEYHLYQKFPNAKIEELFDFPKRERFIIYLLWPYLVFWSIRYAITGKR